MGRCGCGTPSSFPPLLQGRVYADLRDPQRYFDGVLWIVLTLYAIPANSSIVAELGRLSDPDASPGTPTLLDWAG